MRDEALGMWTRAVPTTPVGGGRTAHTHTHQIAQFRGRPQLSDACVTKRALRISLLPQSSQHRKMALCLSSHPTLASQKRTSRIRLFSLPPATLPISFSTTHSNPNLSSSFRINSSLSDQESNITDEWGEKSEPETSNTKLSDADPPKDEDEWGEGEGTKKSEKADNSVSENGSITAVYDKLGELKTTLLDTFYGTELGFRASAEVRAEVLELVNQLESLNPTPAPTSSPSLDGNWVLL